MRVTKKKPLRTKKSSEMNKKPAVRSKAKAKKRPAPRKRSSSQAPSLKRSNHDEHLDTKQQEAAFQVLLDNVLCNSNDEEDFESPFQSNETTSKTLAIIRDSKKKEQLLRRLRRACRLFCTPEFSFTMEQIGEEILSGKLSVREDKVLSADVGLQNILISWYFITYRIFETYSNIITNTHTHNRYDLKWLHLGLETVFGERIQMKHDLDKKTKKNKENKGKLTAAQRRDENISS